MKQHQQNRASQRQASSKHAQRVEQNSAQDDRALRTSSPSRGSRRPHLIERSLHLCQQHSGMTMRVQISLNLSDQNERVVITPRGKRPATKGQRSFSHCRTIPWHARDSHGAAHHVHWRCGEENRGEPWRILSPELGTARQKTKCRHLFG